MSLSPMALARSEFTRPGDASIFRKRKIEASPLNVSIYVGVPRSHGFSLIEVMLALTLMSVGTVSLMELLHRSHSGMAEGESVLIATHLAQRRLEELRNATYASLTSEAKAAITDPTGYSRFSREVTVTTPYTNLKQVAVAVSWTAPGGEASMSLQTYRSAY